MHVTDDPSWSSYLTAVLEFQTAPLLALDLARPIDAGVHAVLHAGPVAVPFAILTAENPRGQPATDGDNCLQRGALDAHLAGEHLSSMQVDGCSPDRRHREVGVAVHLPFEAAKALARRFDQSAIYWYDGRRVWLVPVLVNGEPRVLPVGTPNDG